MLKPIILLSSLLLFSGSLLAKTHIQNSDPLKIRSDRVNFDDNKGLAIYSGAVEVEQRNKILKAHEMYVYRLNQKINKIEAFGNLASFEIKSDNKEPLFGQALS
ncbi:MAG: hypothetical protein JWM09_596, partial [Francisellaceae bacterium]|nr:hypothetical protein [Francisellaceae bacterium]